MKENLSPFLNVWVVPREICPEIAFELSNSTGYSFHLHSNILLDSICIFMPKYAQNISQSVFFGLKSNTHDQLILYSNQKNNFLNPMKICKNIFCHVKISNPSFFQLRRHKSNSTSISFTLPGIEKSSLPSNTKPLPLYNFSGEYTFDDEFDVSTFHELKHISSKKKNILVIVLILESVLMLFAILLKISIRFTIYKLNKKTNKENENREKRPLTVVLNQYCPNTSAMLISV